MSQDVFTHAREGNLIALGKMSSDIDVGTTDANGMTPLMHAAAAGHYKVSGLLIGLGESSLDLRDEEGRTALVHATLSGSHRIVKMLLKKGADPTVVDAEGRTALDHAEAKGDPKTIKQLRAMS